MRILFLSPRQCWPPITGAKLREYYLARALGLRAALTHVFFSQAGSVAPGAAELPFCRKIVPVPQPRRYTVAKLIGGILSGRPLPVLNYSSAEMEAALNNILDSEQFDLVHLDSLHMGAYIPLLERRTRAPIFFDWHNIESEAMRRYGERVASTPRRAYAAVTARRLSAFERYALRKGAGHAVCSLREREQLSRIHPGARIAVVENGVDTQYFAGCGASTGRNRILFAGSMNYYPNIDAAVFFARAVWPRARQRFPHWRLTIMGCEPAPAVLALRGEPGVEVTGPVDDVRPYYREAVAAIVPLRSGGGTRLKILEAMAAGTPVISTPLGAEGLEVSPGSEILIAESREDWLAQLDALAPQADLWERLSRAGRELAHSRYDWETIGDSLYQSYCRWLAQTTGASAG